VNLLRSSHWLLVLALFGCGGGDSGRSPVYEHEIDEQNPALFSQVAVYHLEAPENVASKEDSGGIGWDDIHLAGEGAESRMFCLDLQEGSNHLAQVRSDPERDYVSIDSRTSCATLRTESGRVSVSLFHDGVSEAETIFVYEANASHRSKFSEKNASVPLTIISASGCPSCNLENADLSHRDLRQMDFAGANLRSANVSKSNLASADLFKADLAGLSTDGADLSNTIWSDGTVCAPSSKGICDPFAFTIRADRGWQATGVFLQSGRQALITANGVWTANPATGMTGPAGTPYYIAKPGYALPGAPEGALVGRVGSSAPFLVGTGAASPARQAGWLSFVINDDLLGIYGAGLLSNIGTLQVHVSIREDRTLP
jgi:hypothetical protein